MLICCSSIAKGEFNKKIVSYFRDKDIECHDLFFLEALDEFKLMQNDILILSDQIESTVGDKRLQILNYVYKARQAGARVIFLSTTGDMELLEQMLALGVYDFLLNTFNEMTVIRAVEQPMNLGEAEKVLQKKVNPHNIAKLYSYLGYKDISDFKKEGVDTGTFVFSSLKSAGATFNALNFAIAVTEKTKADCALIDNCSNRTLSKIFDIKDQGTYRVASIPGLDIISSSDVKKIDFSNYDIVVIDTDYPERWANNLIFMVTGTNPYHIQESLYFIQSKRFKNAIPFISGITSNYLQEANKNLTFGIPFVFNIEKAIKNGIPPVLIDKDLREIYLQIYLRCKERS